MEWAEVGKTAVFFHNGGASETCIGNYWYQIYPGGEWWNLSHGEPFLLRSFAGNVDKLAAAVADIAAGQGSDRAVHGRTATRTICTCVAAKSSGCKASLKLSDYNPKRDFVGWGGEDFRRLNGMPGFTHYLRPGARRSRGPGHLQPRFRRRRQARPVPGRRRQGGPAAKRRRIAERDQPARAARGCRAAVWADYNGDGMPDLLLATPTGPQAVHQPRQRRLPRRQPSAAAGARLQPDRGRLDRLRRRRPARHPAGQRLPRPAPLPQQRADR